jgi:RecB family exonuclease
VLPEIATMTALTRELVARSLGRVRPVDPLLREILLEQALEEAAQQETPPPFVPREALASRILAWSDALWMTGHHGEDFFARAKEEFDVPEDLGAERMAAQTRFLEEGLRRYRTKLSALGLEDPSSLFSALVEKGGPFPYRDVFILGGETVEPKELQFLEAVVADGAIEALVPEASAESYPVRRLLAATSFETRHGPRIPAGPVLLKPRIGGEGSFVARDREEVLCEVARLLKARAAEKRLPPLDRIAIVVPSPLPYNYLAKKTLGQAGIPYQLQDDFPLAVEPYLAAVDLVLAFVDRAGRRDAALGLLRSPFFRFPDVGAPAVAALDRELLRLRESGGTDAWRRMRDDRRRLPRQQTLPGLERVELDELPALEALVVIGERLDELGDPETSLGTKVARLRGFLDEFGRLPGIEDRARHERARGAFLSILERLSDAARQVGDPPLTFLTFEDRLHRAIESHTFSERSGRGGVQIVDARSAGLGSFELVVLLGLNEGEWPARSPRNIFYPQWLLKDFGWPTDTDELAAQRSRFIELLRVSSASVVVCRHLLEDEIPTVASPFLDDVEDVIEGRHEILSEDMLDGLVISRAEALRAGWIRTPRNASGERRASVGPLPFLRPEPVSATAFELYLKCPFKYYARHVLGLREEEDVDQSMTPLDRGILLHEILRQGFEQWDGFADRPRAITEENYQEALAVFRRVAVRHLPPARRRLEMERLFGGRGQTGEIEWLLRQEMAKPTLRRRLVEYAFQNHFQFPEGPEGERPWFVRIKGRADRVDVYDDGSVHVLDYKSGRPPDVKVSLQVPLYSACLQQQLTAPRVEGSYLSLRERKVVPRQDPEGVAALLKETYRNITQGRLEPRPYQDFLCNTCGYVGVCRKEIEEPSRAEAAGGTGS